MKFLLFILGLAVAFDVFVRASQTTGAERVLWIVFLVVWCVSFLVMGIIGAAKAAMKYRKNPPTGPFAVNPTDRGGGK